MEYEQIPTNGVIHFNDVIHTLAKNGGHGMTTGDAASLALPSCNVQMESKKKMVACPEHFPNSSEWWKGADKLCGCKPKSLARILIGEISSIYDGKRNGWEYNPPRGNAYNEPYRIDDYKGYYPKAKPMFTQVIAPSNVSRLDTEVSINIVPLANDGKSLTIQDFDTLKDYYIGVILYNEGDSWIVTANNIAANATIVSFAPNQLTEGATYKVLPILSPAQFTLSSYGSFVGGELLTVTGVQYAEIQISSVNFYFNDLTDGVQRTFGRKRIDYDNDGNPIYSVEFQVSVKHDSESQITINNGKAFLRYGNYGSLIPNAEYDFIESPTNIQADKWIGIGEGKIEIPQSIWEKELDIYIGLNGEDDGRYKYGINLRVEDIV